MTKQTAHIPTGHAALDEAIGVGGYPRGYITEIFGPGPGFGLALRAVAAAQGQGLQVALVDLGPQLSPVTAQKIGIDMRALVVSQPHVDDACDVIESFARTRAIDLIVVGCTELIDPKRASSMLRRVSASAHRSGVAVLCVDSQGRTTRAPMTAFRFYSSLRLYVSRDGGRTVARVVKNKHAVPFREADVTGPVWFSVTFEDSSGDLLYEVFDVPREGRSNNELLKEASREALQVNPSGAPVVHVRVNEGLTEVASTTLIV